MNHSKSLELAKKVAERNRRFLTSIYPEIKVLLTELPPLEKLTDHQVYKITLFYSDHLLAISRIKLAVSLDFYNIQAEVKPYEYLELYSLHKN